MPRPPFRPCRFRPVRRLSTIREEWMRFERISISQLNDGVYCGGFASKECRIVTCCEFKIIFVFGRSIDWRGKVPLNIFGARNNKAIIDNKRFSMEMGLGSGSRTVGTPVNGHYAKLLGKNAMIAICRRHCHTKTAFHDGLCDFPQKKKIIFHPKSPSGGD